MKLKAERLKTCQKLSRSFQWLSQNFEDFSKTAWAVTDRN